MVIRAQEECTIRSSFSEMSSPKVSSSAKTGLQVKFACERPFGKLSKYLTSPVVVHRRPSNWYKYQINYLEFWSVNGGQQAPLFSCGTTEAGNADLYTTESFPADLLVPAEDIHVFDGLAGSDYNGILNFKGAFSSYHHPSMRIIGVDYIPIDDF